MLCVRAPSLERRLIILARLTGKTKSHYVRLALEALFEEMNKSEEGFALDILDDPELDFSLLFPPAPELVMRE